MKTAHFIGDHAKDGLLARLGWALTRLVQAGTYQRITHVEAIHEEHDDGSVTIASASIRDGGCVRSKRVTLNPEHWLIIDVPQWDVNESKLWFAMHEGQRYDYRGAFAIFWPWAGERRAEWFCNEAVGASVGLVTPDRFSPAQFAAICVTVSKLRKKDD